MTVFCEDNGSPPLNASSTFVIKVLDWNDNPPVFDSTLYTAEVTEGLISYNADYRYEKQKKNKINK